MKPSKFYDYAIPANGTININVSGEYFKIMATTFQVNVKSSFGELRGLTIGQGLENTPFDDLTIENTGGSVNTFRIFIGDRNFIDGTTGNVGIISNVSSRDTFTQTNPVVTDTASNIAVAAGRDFVLIQNKSSTGTVYLNFQTTATIQNGVRLLPGQTWESGFSCPQQIISAIGDIANNPNVIVITGN